MGVVRFRTALMFASVCLYGVCLNAQQNRPDDPPVATYSIIAIDSETEEIGVAVQSRIPAVGSIVPWVQAGVGAIATQSFSNVRYGPEGLKLLAEGMTAEEAIQKLTDNDPDAARRQLGMIDARGNKATFTGEACLPWAGGKVGKHCVAQGNILHGEAVIDAMIARFEQAEGTLAERLIDALQAGQDAGGEKRGMQSAALYVARKDWGYAGLNDRFRDIRVDDAPDPIAELRRIHRIHKELFRRPE
ncbi:MAG: DUF1028 domain-containing protein [Pirellulaceae bacterium]